MAINRASVSHQLFIAGTIQQEQYGMAMKHFIQMNGLHVHWCGWKKDMMEFYRLMRYSLNTSLCESQCCAVMEAMATGCKPLVYAWPGADEIYPEWALWKNDDSMMNIVRESYKPKMYRAWIENNYSLQLQSERTTKMLLSGETIEWTSPK